MCVFLVCLNVQTYIYICVCVTSLNMTIIRLLPGRHRSIIGWVCYRCIYICGCCWYICAHIHCNTLQHTATHCTYSWDISACVSLVHAYMLYAYLCDSPHHHNVNIYIYVVIIIIMLAYMLYAYLCDST